MPQFTIHRQKKISHDIEKKIYVWQHFVFVNLSISLFLWRDKINTEINASVALLALLFWNGVQGNYRRVMAACVGKVYDIDKNILHLVQRPLRCWGHRLQSITSCAVVICVQWKKANRNKFKNIVRQCAIHVVGMIKVCPLRNTAGHITTILFNGDTRTTKIFRKQIFR